MLTLAQEHLLIRQAQDRHNLLCDPSSSESCSNHHFILRQGERALVQLIEANQRLIYRLTRYFVSIYHYSAYEDLEQEAKKAVIEAVHTFDFSKGTRLITWVFWKIRTQLSQQSRKTKTQNAAQAAAIATVEDAFEPVQADPVLVQQLEQLLEQLTPYQREVVERRMQGETFKEIAQALNRSVPAVRMLFHRQLQKFKSWLLPDSTPQTPVDVAPTSWMHRLRDRFRGVQTKCSLLFAALHNQYRAFRKPKETAHESSNCVTWSCGSSSELEASSHVLARGRDRVNRSRPTVAGSVLAATVRLVLDLCRRHSTDSKVQTLLPKKPSGDRVVLLRSGRLIWTASERSSCIGM
ncbi:MAG TPA: sigma-70 family RNA polymerase sigma factor [Stenomitos sp.]